MTRLRDLSISIYQMAHEYARDRGIIIADTKFEFGLDDSSICFPVQDADGQKTIDHTPILIDEVLTPDSSRFWPANEYEPGRDQSSIDKQYVRNYLQQLADNDRWNKTPPGPALPDEIIRNTLAKYLEALRALTGQELCI